MFAPQAELTETTGKMANLQNRTRVVYVRVSDEEFQRFRDLRQKYGARNMSDLVRVAMETMGRQRETDFENEVTHRLRELETSLDHLKRSIEQITAERHG
jgi:hypothetical protein